MFYSQSVGCLFNPPEKKDEKPGEIAVQFLQNVKDGNYNEAEELIDEKINNQGYHRYLNKWMRRWNANMNQVDEGNFKVKKTSKNLKSKMTYFITISSKYRAGKLPEKFKKYEKKRSVETYFYVSKIDDQWKITAAPFDIIN